ncbi:MAG: DUF1007 family protein [Campylobacterota bacterium]|nr:DUF1007 family protein [Campylobacterota bacterium]
MSICCKFIFILLVPFFLFAHPHIFVDISAKYNTKEQQIYILWLIDDASSELIKLDYDTNKNNHFEPQELKKFLDKEEGYAMLFYRSNFFLHPKRVIKHLDATIIDGRVQITFETDSSACNFIDIWDEDILFSFHVKDILNMKHIQESKGYFGARFELEKIE